MKALDGLNDARRIANSCNSHSLLAAFDSEDYRAGGSSLALAAADCPAN